MKTAITTCQMLIRGTGLLQILLGLLFWLGYARNLIPIHMLIGLVLVLSLWVLAVLAARSGVSLGFVALAIVWGVIVVLLGVTQTQLLPGAFHWVIQLVHLAIGLAAMGMGERLATMSLSSREPVLSA
ncbi:MAG: hypothetical protein DYG89_46000 [Caldilinea sp. CFX5]|nr:hypothetical protein [Caldilinea sp. CFX5]